MRVSILLGGLVLAAAAQAQPARPASPSEPLNPRENQKVERIVHEDAGSRIEERRYAGQTERITVQPKGGMPAYEVEPVATGRSRPADTRDTPSPGGQRRWNVLNF